MQAGTGRKARTDERPCEVLILGLMRRGKNMKHNPLKQPGALGHAAIAITKVACQIYQEIFGSDRFRKPAAQDARVQRLLWAGAGAKNPDYSDVKYIEALIGPDRVNNGPTGNP